MNAWLPPSCLLKLTRLCLVVAFSASAAGAHADLVILQYHHVSNKTPTATSTTPSLFRGQLDMIEKLELPVEPLDRGTRAALKSELERQAVAITFDDAYESVYKTAAPMLIQREMPFTVFVNTQAIDSKRHGYMTWEQLRELGENPLVTIGNHSTDHGHLAQKPGEPEDAWLERISQSLDKAHDQISEKLGVDTALFAYPYGEYDQKLEKQLAERDWLGFGQHSGPVGKTSGPTRLPRFPMATAYGQLNNLSNKLTSRALPVPAETLPDSVITENPPTLTLKLTEDLKPGRLTCYGSGVGKLPISEADSDGSVTVSAQESFSSRRFRYNCTHPAGAGEFYWLSKQWLDLTRQED